MHSPENMGGIVESKHQPILLPFTNVQGYQYKQLIPTTSQAKRGGHRNAVENESASKLLKTK